MTVDEATRLQAFDTGQPKITKASQGENSFATISLPIRDYTNDTAGLAEISVKRDAALAQVTGSRDVSLGAGLGILLLMGMAAWLAITRIVVRPLQLMTKSAAAVSAGDVSQQVHVNSKGEIGQLARSFGEMVNYIRKMVSVAEAVSHGDLTQEVHPRSDADVLGNALKRMISNLREILDEVSSSAMGLAEASQQLLSGSSQASAATQQIAATIQQVANGNHEQSRSVQETSESVSQLTRAIDQIARGAQDQARSIQQASASVAELNANVSRVAASSEQVSAAAEQAHVAATTGGEVVRKTAAGMSTIRNNTETIASKIQELERYSEQIGIIVETIDGIAE